VFHKWPVERFNVLYYFDLTHGAWPTGRLAEDSLGNLYGTTAIGGNLQSCRGQGCGVVYELQGNEETVLYAFSGGADGSHPAGGVIRDEQGNLYGTTQYGGSSNCLDGCGVVFKVDPLGNETVLHSFTGGSDGEYPTGGLARDSAGNLYGTTASGGLGYGVAFMISSQGNEGTIYTFTGGVDGAYPSDLLWDGKGNLYGATCGGGEFSNGIVYKLISGDRQIVVYSFNGTEAYCPDGPLILNGAALYGVASGGANNDGVVFKLTMQ
jgi:uncharacterized repeat protein (TIGR03803 family)